MIRGTEYGVRRMSCTTFTTDARKVLLSQFRFRINERFLYEYDFGDLWQHQIRFEGVQPIRGKNFHPVCVGGACASPPEDCGGPKANFGCEQVVDILKTENFGRSRNVGMLVRMPFNPSKRRELDRSICRGNAKTVFESQNLEHPMQECE